VFDASEARLTPFYIADSIPINPPHGSPPPPPGQLLPDVQMAESSTEVGSQPDDTMHEGATMKTETMGSPELAPHVNGNGHPNGDVQMHASMDSVAADGSNSSTGSMRRSAEAMLEDEPPAKRARKMSGDEQAGPTSFGNVSLPSLSVRPYRRADLL
jgi:hypothetical protein